VNEADAPLLSPGGRGTSFAGGETVRAPHDEAVSRAKQPPAKLLIVEDDHLVAMELESVLLDAGFEVTGIAATAEDALRKAQSLTPDLVLMDIRLAGARDGVDAAIDLYSQMGIRCVFATAHHDNQTQARAQPAQPLGWLAKPYQPATLLQVVRTALAVLKA
jgi:DNA-binding NarL/FixJ family response regulator